MTPPPTASRCIRADTGLQQKVPLSALVLDLGRRATPLPSARGLLRVRECATGDSHWWGRAQTGRTRADNAVSPHALGSLPMPKAYAVVTYRSVSYPEKLAAYAELALPAVMPFGARILARGNAAVAREHGLKERTVVTEFPSLKKATAAYDSDAYAEALKALGDGAVRDFRIVEGVE